MAEPSTEPTARDPLYPWTQADIDEALRRKTQPRGPGIPSARIHEVLKKIEQLPPGLPDGPEQIRKLFAELKG